jgi:zona occludens toxin (predicted ATPase)
MNQNGKHGNLAAVDVLDEENQQTETTAFYDSNSPLLKPAREDDKTKRRSWKRRLVRWSFVLLLIAGGAIALYLLLRVNRVNVKVQADSPRDSEKTKAKDAATNSENNLTADAINIARNATGIDRPCRRPRSNSTMVRISDPRATIRR